MPKIARVQPGGFVFHVLNRGNARMTVFNDDDDYAAFERIMAEAVDRNGMRRLAYCLMPNHWQSKIAAELGLEATMRAQGRPWKNVV